MMIYSLRLCFHYWLKVEVVKETVDKVAENEPGMNQSLAYTTHLHARAR